MAQDRALAGVLALATLILVGGGEVLVVTHTGGPLGLFALAFAAPAGIAAWVALGSPARRSDLRA